MTAPYLDVVDFETEFGRLLTEAETLTATRLLQVVSDWIRGQKSDADVTASVQVVFEVVRDALNYGSFERLTSFQNVTSLRTEAGTFDEAFKVVNDYLTNRHKRLLGIAVAAAPVGHFPVNDY